MSERFWIQPLEGKLIVKPVTEKPKESESGILLGTSSSAEALRFIVGEVMATGGSKYRDGKYEEMDIKVGHKILFDELKAGEFTRNLEKYYALSEDSGAIYGILINDTDL
jgi:co-chaperonin GroES (HSP10)